MATYDLTANAKTIYGTVNTNDISILNKIQNLENKVNEQSEKLKIKVGPKITMEEAIKLLKKRIRH